MIAFADFSGDEILCFVLAIILASVGWTDFYRPIFSIPLLGRSIGLRLILSTVPLLGLGMAGIVLCRWADAQVVGHADYIFLFVVVGAAFQAVAFGAMTILGVSIRNDVVDRNNPAALAMASGAILAMSTIYALANVGGGPTIWTTIHPAAQALLVLFTLTLLMESTGLQIVESATIDRDIAAGIRTAGALMGCGLVLGRAAGGVWISFAQSLVDLAYFGWPAIVIAITAGLVHRKLRPSPTHPKAAVIIAGIIPAIVFVSTGFFSVVFMPHGLHPSLW